MAYPPVQCFIIEATDQIQRQLRRYESGECSLFGTYHNKCVDFDTVDRSVDQDGKPLDSDPRWPTCCDCGHRFSDNAEYQLFTNVIYKRIDNGETCTLRDAPPGAMYNATWLTHYEGYCGPDGQSLTVILPNGRAWNIDGQASNCTLKDDKVHKCWVRHGIPPLITVDKNGNTCAAGGGSIQAGESDGEN
jgi:hypothetical protein